MRAATATYEYEDPRHRYSVRKSLDSYLNQLTEGRASSMAGAINFYSSHKTAQSYISSDTRLVGQSVSTSPGWALEEDFLPVVEPPPKMDVASLLDEKVANGIAALLKIAADEEFESGMDSNLSIGLKASLNRYPEKTLEILTSVLRGQTVSYLVVGEILHILGRVDNAPTMEERFAMLIGYLMHASAYLRDAAVVGLAHMNDARAVAPLRKAIAAESLPSLRDDMETIVHQLED